MHVSSGLRAEVERSILIWKWNWLQSYRNIKERHHQLFYCFCHYFSLEQMRLALIEDGLDDINFLVVNSGGWMSRVLSYSLRNRVSFPVYEEGYFTSIWDTLNGAKDDILVYDRWVLELDGEYNPCWQIWQKHFYLYSKKRNHRSVLGWLTRHYFYFDIFRCGFLTYHLRMPYSFLSYPYVEGAIRVTYHGDDPCDCNLPLKANVTTPPTVENTNGSMGLERNATMGVNTKVENNTVIEHVCCRYVFRYNHLDIMIPLLKKEWKKF